MSGSKGFRKRQNRRRCAKAGEVGKPFPPPGGFYIQWPATDTTGKYERFSSVKKQKKEINYH